MGQLTNTKDLIKGFENFNKSIYIKRTMENFENNSDDKNKPFLGLWNSEKELIRDLMMFKIDKIEYEMNKLYNEDNDDDLNENYYK
jgi:DICT domain-containing protein